MQGRAAPRLWVVGMRCHSKENYGWPKERHNRVHACWLRFCFMLLGDLGGCLFERADRLLLFPDISRGRVKISLTRRRPSSISSLFSLLNFNDWYFF